MNQRVSISKKPQHLSRYALEAYAVFPAAAILVLIVIWLSTFHLIRTEGKTAELKAVDSARELVETYEAQMIRNLGAIDQALKMVAYEYDQKGNPQTLGELKENGLLPSTLIFTIGVADKAGNIIAHTSSREWGSIASQAYFERHKKDPSPFTAVGLVDWSNGAKQILFSRRLNANDGSFNGLAMVLVDPGYFTSGYEPKRLGEHGVLGLIDEKGMFVAKRTGDEVSYGQLADRASMAAGSNTEDGNAVLAVNAWDRTRRYTNTRALYNFPLAVIVGLSQEEQLENFKQQRQTYLWVAIGFSIFVAGIAAMLTRLSWQLSRNRMRIRKDQETYYAASEASLDAIFVLRSERNHDGTIHDFIVDTVNQRAAAIFGTEKAKILGRRLCDLLPQCRENGVLSEFAAVAETGVVHEKEWKSTLPTVNAKWLYRQTVKVEDGVVVIIRDITERKEIEERISHMAHHDALTGLPNRSLLDDRIRQAMLYVQRYNQCMTVVFMDLDNFKLINDGLGHKAGDELLKTVASRMVQSVRQVDTVVRLGGDEFVLVLIGQSTTTESIIPVLQKIREAIAEPIYIDGQKLEVTCSMGLATYPGDGENSDTLLMNADAAMYQAKALGRNNYQFYMADMNTKIHQRLALQEGLRNALSREEFFLMYQPQIDLRSGMIIGIESLIRWSHPEKGLVSPCEFISLAEETGLIVPIGEWVLRTACRQNKAWQNAGMAPIVISVNVSARQFKEKSLVQQVKKAIEDSGLAPCYLELEVTESLIMQDLSQAQSTMKELQVMGVHLSIDDFGIGYSSLNALKSFPINRLKIDRSFIQDLPYDEDDKAITRAVISLGHELNLRVLAEGVETEEQYTFLKENGCDDMQGYYFSKPVQAEEMAALIDHLKPGQMTVISNTVQKSLHFDGAGHLKTKPS